MGRRAKGSGWAVGLKEVRRVGRSFRIRQTVALLALLQVFKRLLFLLLLCSVLLFECELTLAVMLVFQPLLEKLLQTSKSGLTYFAEYKSGRLEHKMDHLGCFVGTSLHLAPTSHVVVFVLCSSLSR